MSEREPVPSLPVKRFDAPKRLQLALPTGELEGSVKKFLCVIGLDVPDAERTYRISMNRPDVDLLFFRASAIPGLVRDIDSDIQAGITGSDILLENRDFFNYAIADMPEIPIFELVPEAPRSRLYFGVTERFANKIAAEEGRPPTIYDASGQTIITKFPNISRRYARWNGLEQVRIDTVAGTDEAYQYAYSDKDFILGIVSTGKTLEANDIRVLEIVLDVTVKLVESREKIGRSARSTLNDLWELMTVTLLKKRSPTSGLM